MPALLLLRPGPCRHDTVQMHMLIQLLSPGMQHRRDTQLPLQAFRVFAKRFERLPDGLEQTAVNHL
jgi:hypothetical protein